MQDIIYPYRRNPAISHPPPPVLENAYRLQTSPLRGFQHYDDGTILPSLKPGEPLELIPEPANPHDRYAVRVHHNNRHIGYLPRQSNHVVSRLLRQGAPLRARIAWLSPDFDSATPLSIEVFLEKPTS